MILSLTWPSTNVWQGSYRTCSCQWHGCLAVGLNLKTRQLPRQYKAEISQDMTLNYNNKNLSNSTLILIYRCDLLLTWSLSHDDVHVVLRDRVWWPRILRAMRRRDVRQCVPCEMEIRESNCWVNESISASINELMIQWIKEWNGESMNQWTSEPMNG